MSNNEAAHLLFKEFILDTEKKRERFISLTIANIKSAICIIIVMYCIRI